MGEVLRPTPSIDELLERALEAVNRGDVAGAHLLATQVLAADADNPEAEHLLLAEPPAGGELRRLTIMFCDLVGSTALSARHEPERYRRIVRRYKQTCQHIIEGEYEGHIAEVKGDGMLAVFGHPSAHEDDAWRAVKAGLDVVAAVRRLSAAAEREVGERLAARVGVHRGLVYLDTEEDDVYGLAVNVAARLQDLAPAGSLVISEEVLRLLDARFETEPQDARPVKGVEEPLQSWRVIGERPGVVAAQRRWPTPLAGRGEELERLRHAWRSRPGAVLVRGEPGIGKSRLIGALAAEVTAEGARVIEVDGSPSHTVAGFHSLRTTIERSCGIGRDTDAPARLRLLRRHLDEGGLDSQALVPLLGPVLGIEPGAGYVAAASDAPKLHEEIADAMEHYLAATTAGGPSLLVAEDIQWFDDSTRQVLDGLLARSSPELLVVMSARPDVSPPRSKVETIDLEPLSPPESLELARAIDPLTTAADDHEDLVARSDGVPLFLEELVRAAMQSPSRAHDGRTIAHPHGAPEHVPEVLYEPLLARLHATGDVRVAAAAATIGREVDRDLLAQVVDIGEAELVHAVTALLDGSIFEQDEGRPQRLRFRHALLREVAYELQPPSMRQAVHSRVADAMAGGLREDGVADWVALAGHYERAERASEAVDSYERAAGEARRRGAMGEARAYLGHAVDLLYALPESPWRNGREIGLLLQRGFLAVSSEGNASPDAGGDYERCIELSMRDRSRDEMFTALISLWGFYASRGDLSRAHQVLGALRTVMTDGREWFRSENDAGFGILSWFGGRFHDAHEQLEEAAQIAVARGRDDRVGSSWFLPNDPMAAIFTHLALARFTRGDPAGAVEAFVTAEQVAAELPFPQGPFSAAYNRTYQSWFHQQVGELDRAELLSTDVLELAQRHGFSFWTLAATTQQVELQVRRAIAEGRADGTTCVGPATTLEGLISAWRMIDTRIFLPSVMTTLGITLAAAGHADGAQERFDDALALADATGVHFCRAETLRARAHLAADPEDVERQLRNALGVAREQGAVVFEVRIARDLFLLRGDPARPELDAALRLPAPGASYPELDAARALVAADG